MDATIKKIDTKRFRIETVVVEARLLVLELTQPTQQSCSAGSLGSRNIFSVRDAKYKTTSSSTAGGRPLGNTLTTKLTHTTQWSCGAGKRRHRDKI